MIGARIKQARLLAGMTLTQLADELQRYDFPITKQAISKYEKEKSYPSAQFLLLASSVLGVPSTYFTHQPTKSVEWLAFRCRKRLSQRERNKIIAYATDVAELQTELRELLYPNARSILPSIPVTTLEDAENAAAQLRRQWNVGDRPLDNLVQTCEDRNVMVVGWIDETGLFDGLSGRCGDHPVTVINTHFPLDRQRLTLAHEIGHLVMDIGSDADTDEETLAFRFAAALLVPNTDAYSELGNTRSQLSWIELETLKRKYGISMSAWVRRAKDLSIISENHFRELMMDMSSRGWRKSEPVEYKGDEEPLQLKQMVQRAYSEGLVEAEMIAHLDFAISEPKDEMMPKGEYPSATELLAMDEEERQRWIARMFQWAEGVEFEEFEAYGEEEF